MGIVKYFKYYQGKITTVFIKFDDENAGKSLTASDSFARENGCVPIVRIL